MIAFLVLLPFSCFFEHAPFVSIAPSLTLTYINYDNYRVSSCLYVNRDIEDCAEQFKARNLPLHGLINNIGTENPPDIKSKEGFDVSLAVSSRSFPLLQSAAHSCKMPLCSEHNHEVHGSSYGLHCSQHKPQTTWGTSTSRICCWRS